MQLDALGTWLARLAGGIVLLVLGKLLPGKSPEWRAFFRAAWRRMGPRPLTQSIQVDLANVRVQIDARDDATITITLRLSNFALFPAHVRLEKFTSLIYNSYGLGVPPAATAEIRVPSRGADSLRAVLRLPPADAKTILARTTRPLPRDLGRAEVRAMFVLRLRRGLRRGRDVPYERSTDMAALRVIGPEHLEQS